VRIATWNVNSVGARLPRLVEWLSLARPDVLAVQETKCAADAFPYDEVREVGYDVEVHGDGRWNGVGLITRQGLNVADVRRGYDDEALYPDDATAAEARAMAATVDGVRVWSVYVPNGREVDSDHYAYKLRWLSAFTKTIEHELSTHDRLVVMGDFNIAPTDADVWDPAVFVGSTHVTGPERAAYQGLVDLGLVDLEARALKGDHPFTYWDYRAGSFHKGMGMRIDLVMATKPLASAVTDAYVDREARKGKGPSDHAPVVVDMSF
jgi:exodeoxyribonuclease III